MTVEEYVASLARRPEYAIIEYLIDENTIVMFVDRLTSEQSEIPKTVYGRNIIITQSM